MNILKIQCNIFASILILLVVNFNSTAQSSLDNSNNDRVILKAGEQNNTGLQLTNEWDTNFGGIYGRNHLDGTWDKAIEIRDESNNPRISIRNKYVGIGTINPEAELHVKGWAKLDGNLDLNGVALVGNVAKWSNGNDLSLKYSIIAEKGILSEKVKVAVKDLTDWSDYVFEEDYEMLPIDELEDYVTENKHLPNVPSAEEMVESGLDVAKMDAKLLEKIEEAYLYIIDINKAMEAMNEKVDALSTENEVLKTSLQSLSTSGK